MKNDLHFTVWHQCRPRLVFHFLPSFYPNSKAFNPYTQQINTHHQLHALFHSQLGHIPDPYIKNKEDKPNIHAIEQLDGGEQRKTSSKTKYFVRGLDRARDSD